MVELEERYTRQRVEAASPAVSAVQIGRVKCSKPRQTHLTHIWCDLVCRKHRSPVKRERECVQSPREVFKLRKVRGSLIVASLSVKRAVGEAKGRDPPSRREEAQGTWSGPGQLDSGSPGIIPFRQVNTIRWLCARVTLDAALHSPLRRGQNRKSAIVGIEGSQRRIRAGQTSRRVTHAQPRCAAPPRARRPRMKSSPAALAWSNSSSSCARRPNERAASRSARRQRSVASQRNAAMPQSRRSDVVRKESASDSEREPIKRQPRSASAQAVMLRSVWT